MTESVIELIVCLPTLSVQVNVITCEPTSLRVVGHENWLATEPFATIGSAGFIVAPGCPFHCSVTTPPTFDSALTWKKALLPAGTVNPDGTVEPFTRHVGGCPVPRFSTLRIRSDASWC